MEHQATNLSTKNVSAKRDSMSTNPSRRALVVDAAVPIESPTLLSKLEQLESQMKLAFPSSSRPDRNLPEIRSPKQQSASSQPSSVAHKPATQSKPPKGDNKENKENVNEKSISTDDKIGSRDKQPLKSANSELKSATPSGDQQGGNEAAKNSQPIIKTNVTERNPVESTSAALVSPQASAALTVNTAPNASTTTVNTAPIKHVSAWKRVSKTLSTMEVIRVMKSRTAAAQASASQPPPQQSLRPKEAATEGLSLKKSASGTLAISESHHLNSPSTQIKRRSQEEVSTGLAPNTPRLSSSCQTSIHNLNEATKTQTSLQAALSNLSGSSGTFHHQIPDNYNTNLINQLNKNYLKNIQKQKARSDWKSLKSKLIGLAKKEGEESAPGSADTPDSLATPAANTVQRKLSNTAANQANQASQGGQADDGIICKKEDLLFLLRNSNLMNKQRRSNKPSMADVVKQLQESKSRKSDAVQQTKPNLPKNQSDSNESLVKSSQFEGQAGHENTSASLSKAANSTGLAKGKQSTSNGRVQFVLSGSNEPATPTNSSAPVTKIKSSLKKTSSSASGSLDKGPNNLVRQTKSNTINNSNLHKKKVKIFETDQDGIRKALMLQSVKDRNNNENLLNDNEEERAEKNQIKINKQEEEEELAELNVQHQKLKWDEQNEVDAGLLGDAIQAFLSTITTNVPTNSAATFSTSKPLASEKKVSFKK